MNICILLRRKLVDNQHQPGSSFNRLDSHYAQIFYSMSSGTEELVTPDVFGRRLGGGDGGVA